MFFLAWGTDTKKVDLGLIKQKCPNCKKSANFLFFKVVRTTKLFWIIPIWQSTKYYFTCGSCHATFEFDKEKGKEMDEKIQEDKENKKKLEGGKSK